MSLLEIIIYGTMALSLTAFIVANIIKKIIQDKKDKKNGNTKHYED